jgi:hypothetical protein
LISSEIVANYAALQFKTSMPEKTEKTKLDEKDLSEKTKLDEKDLALAKAIAALKENKKTGKTNGKTNEREIAIAMDTLRWWTREQKKL